MTSKESVIFDGRSEFKGGDPIDVKSIQGRDLIEQALSSNLMAEFKDIIKKDSEVQNKITQIVEKYNKESHLTQSITGQNALIPSKVIEQVINIMGDTIENMDLEKEQKDKKIEYLENKIGLPDCRVIDEKNSLGSKNISSIRKGDRIMDRLNNSLSIHKYKEKENKKSKLLK